jgi:hypothetical protein
MGPGRMQTLERISRLLRTDQLVHLPVWRTLLRGFGRVVVYSVETRPSRPIFIHIGGPQAHA